MKTARISAALATFLVAASSVAAFATPIQLNSGSWSFLPGTTGTITLSAVNVDNGTQVTTFNGWALGVQLLPSLGATGSATLGETAFNPATNPSLTDADPTTDVLPNTLNVATNGTLDYFNVSLANNTATSTTWASGQSYNLISLLVTLSANASGSWTLFLVNDANNVAAWYTSGGVDTSFGNLSQGDGSSFTAGVVSAITAAVPEPGSLGLAGVAAAMGLGVSLVRRGRRGNSAQRPRP